MPLSRNNLGQSKFPPNPNQWDAERNGLLLRSEFGRSIQEPLRPFDIAGQIDGVTLLGRPEFVGIIGPDCAHKLHERYRDSWSGFVVPVDGNHLVVINTTHPETRQHATLTEELFHIRLKHEPCKLSPCPITGLMKREYTRQIEHEAYWSAGAALLPYAPLKHLVLSGTPIEKIAEMFDVSVSLVQMRMKLTKLWRRR
jgi:hypothetical protein